MTDLPVIFIYLFICAAANFEQNCEYVSRYNLFRCLIASNPMLVKQMPAVQPLDTGGLTALVGLYPFSEGSATALMANVI